MADDTNDEQQAVDDQPVTSEAVAVKLDQLELEFYELKQYVKKVMGRVAAGQRRDRQDVEAQPAAPCSDDINTMIRDGTYGVRRSPAAD